MFKKLLNKNRLEAAERERQADDVASMGTQQSTSGSSIGSTTTKSSTVSAVIKGKKKLSSMMNKLNTSGRKFRFGRKGSKKSSGQTVMDDDQKQQHKQTNHHLNMPYDFDSDDDDDAYKSAEENSPDEDEEEEEEEVDEEIVRSQKNKEVTFLANSKSASQATNMTKKYPIDSEKFILPEEQCDIPTFLQTANCDAGLIDETRRLLRERAAKNPDSFYDHDYERMLTDDWTVTRFLLRRRLDPKRTAKLMEECGRFRKQYKMSEVQHWEFPIEFHKAGGLFKYATDRVGNVTMYMRVKMYRRVPEISDVFKAFILCVLEQCDVANNGRGTAVIFDLSGCGLQNVDLGFLSWLLSSFRNYCPKGVSYIIVYNLPWILNATCKLAMTWMSASNRRALRFCYGKEIENFIARENMPDYCGGTCKMSYKQVPEGSKPAIEVCDRLDMTKEQALKIKELFKEYLTDDYDTISEKTTINQKALDARSNYDDAKSTMTTIDTNSELNSFNNNQQQIANGSTNNTLQQRNNTSSTNNTISSAPHHHHNHQLNVNGNHPAQVVDLVSKASKFMAQ